MALAFGDSTAKRAGRLNLNPIRHVDPVGTLLVPAVLSLSGVGAYGWAKPVPVNPGNLRSPRNHVVLVSLVGPLTNFVLAAIMGVCFVAAGDGGDPVPVPECAGHQLSEPDRVHQLFRVGAADLSLRGAGQHRARGVQPDPVPALDGASVLERMLPARYLPGYWNLQPFLMFLPLILILLFRNQWSSLIDHVFAWWLSLLG